MRCKGFTLVEILFVVLIAAGVIAFAVPAYKRMQERAAYNAALGTLLDIHNAVGSLKRDLQTSTGVSVTIPAENVSYVKYGDSNWSGTAPADTSDVAKGKIPWNEYVVNQSGANLTKAFMWALHNFDYLKPLEKTEGYEFYILKDSGSSTLSKCKLDGARGVACMYKTGTTKDCYQGAVVLADGTISRLKGTNCKN